MDPTDADLLDLKELVDRQNTRLETLENQLAALQRRLEVWQPAALDLLAWAALIYIRHKDSLSEEMKETYRNLGNSIEQELLNIERLEQGETRV